MRCAVSMAGVKLGHVVSGARVHAALAAAARLQQHCCGEWLPLLALLLLLLLTNHSIL
jgi:hypothetical protein